MKKIELGQAIAIFANLGVLAGIVFLAIEIRESNIQTRIVNQTAIVGQSASSLLSIANDVDSSSIYFRGMTGYADLSDEDKVGNVAIYFEYKGFREWWAEMDRRTLLRPLISFIDAVEEDVVAESR